MASSRHAMQSNYIKQPTTGSRSFEIDAMLYMNCIDCTVQFEETPQCFLFLCYKKGSYDRILSTDLKVRMTHTITLKK